MCQQGHWTPKGVDLVGSHIEWRKERVGFKGGWNCEIPHRLGRRNETPKGVETSPKQMQMRFKNLEGKLERKRSKKTVSISSGTRRSTAFFIMHSVEIFEEK